MCDLPVWCPQPRLRWSHGCKRCCSTRLALYRSSLSLGGTAACHAWQGCPGTHAATAPQDLTLPLPLLPPLQMCSLGLGAPKPPLPVLRIKGGSNPLAGFAKPVCAATIRAGPGYLEVPFVATHEAKRGRGYGRCMVEAIEDLARALRVPLLLLCSTNDEAVKATWLHLGFSFSTDEDMARFGVEHTDLVHMSNTVQMHKFLGAKQRFKSVIIRHQHYVQRSYVPMGRDPAAKRQNFRSAGASQRYNGATTSAGTVITGGMSEEQ